jgi:hypothetical protein
MTGMFPEKIRDFGMGVHGCPVKDLGSLKGSVHLEDIPVDRRIILNMLSEWRVWNFGSD